MVPDLRFDLASKSLIYQYAPKWTDIGDKVILALQIQTKRHVLCSVTTCMDNRTAPNMTVLRLQLDHVEAPNGPRYGVILQKYGHTRTQTEPSHAT